MPSVFSPITLGVQKWAEGSCVIKVGGTEVQPGLAETYEANADLTEWTFHLRKDVKFSDGTPMDANDVVETFVVQWDASNPLHKGNTGVFQYWKDFFGPKALNQPPE